MTATTVTTAAREAIAAGHRLYIGTFSWAQFVVPTAKHTVVNYEREHTWEDAMRTIGREQVLKPEEITARWKGEWSEPYSDEEDDEGEPVPVERARYLTVRLTFTPRKHPLPGAVYTARHALEEATPDSIAAVLHEVEDRHAAMPLAIRLHPRSYADYANALQQFGFGKVTCQGVPVEVARGVGEREVVVVFPLPTEE